MACLGSQYASQGHDCFVILYTLQLITKSSHSSERLVDSITPGKLERHDYFTVYLNKGFANGIFLLFMFLRGTEESFAINREPKSGIVYGKCKS